MWLQFSLIAAIATGSWYKQTSIRTVIRDCASYCKANAIASTFIKTYDKKTPNMWHWIKRIPARHAWNQKQTNKFITFAQIHNINIATNCTVISVSQKRFKEGLEVADWFDPTKSTNSPREQYCRQERVLSSCLQQAEVNCYSPHEVTPMHKSLVLTTY